MKGQKQKDKEKYIDRAKVNRTSKVVSTDVYSIKFTYLDLVPIEFTKQNVLKWLAESGWIEGCIIKYLGDQFPYLDDYIQEIYLLIYDKLDKLIDIYETRGVLAFCGYVKTMIFTNCFAEGSPVYKKIRYFNSKLTVSCDEDMWNDIVDTYVESEGIYRMKKTNELI